MPLFDVAVLVKDQGQEKLLLGPKTVVAKDEKGAILAALTTEKFLVDMDASKLEVLVRPFVDAAPRWAQMYQLNNLYNAYAQSPSAPKSFTGQALNFLKGLSE